LVELIDHPAKGFILLSEEFDVAGTTFFKIACERGLEGMVSKRGDLAYRAAIGSRSSAFKATIFLLSVTRRMDVAASRISSSPATRAASCDMPALPALGFHLEARAHDLGHVSPMQSK
jgi:hypothetical protein